jgi:putative MFS transporter
MRRVRKVAALSAPESSGAGIAERLERIPRTWWTYKIVSICCLAWLVEAFDIGLIGVVLPPLRQLWALHPSDLSQLAIASTIGIVIGVVPSGILSDQIGRKKMLMLGMSEATFLTLAAALSPSLRWLVVLRLLAGLGMGAMFPLPYALVSEFVSSRTRGRFTGVMDSLLSVGYFVSPLLGALIIPNVALNLGWRVLFLLGGLPLLYVVVIAKYLPESPRWYESKGRQQEAEAVMCSIESEVSRQLGGPLPPIGEVTPVLISRERVPLRTLWEPMYRKRTVMCWLAFGCTLFLFYSIQIFMPTVVASMGFSMTSAFLFTAIIVGASIPGKLLEAVLVERWGRIPVIVSFTLIAAICAFAFGFVRGSAMVLGVGIVMSFFGIGANPAVKVFVAENYPTRVRGTGVSSAEAVGRLISGVLAPAYFPFLLANHGVAAAYSFVGVLSLGGVVVVALLGTETKGRLLEEISR